MQMDVRRRLALVRAAGATGTAHLLAERLLLTSELLLGLRCDLNALPPVRPARVPLVVRARDSRSFPEFTRELRMATGYAALGLRDRQELCDAGVEQLFAAETPAGSVAYVHWCVTSAGLPALQAVLNDRFRPLTAHEVLVEGAYTFPAMRRIGAMTNGLGQQVRMARAAGATTAYCYVAATNVASIRGFAAAGFQLDHTRTDVARFGQRHSEYSDAGPDAQRIWRAALRC